MKELASLPPSGLVPKDLASPLGPALHLPWCQAEDPSLYHMHGPLENIPDQTVAGQDESPPEAEALWREDWDIMK